jgi:arylsulfatase A-like enzyme
MGTLRTELEKMGVRDNTLLWFNSDNGVTTQEIPKDQLQHLDNGGLRGHKSQMYEG